jgi:hypothetical protein
VTRIDEVLEIALTDHEAPYALAQGAASEGGASDDVAARPGS